MNRVLIEALEHFGQMIYVSRGVSWQEEQYVTTLLYRFPLAGCMRGNALTTENKIKRETSQGEPVLQERPT